MPRPKQPYLVNGEPVPGVTTILGRFKESGGLMHWAWSQGKAGLDYRAEKDRAANVGTLTHAMVEAYLTGGDPLALMDGVAEGIAAGAATAYQAWRRWQAVYAVEIESWEKPLTCSHILYGGTPDALLRSNGAIALGDWKTGGLYVETLCQLAAYGHLFKDAGMPIGGGYHIGRFSPETGDFTHRYFEELDEAWEMFKALRFAYDQDKALAKRLKA